MIAIRRCHSISPRLSLGIDGSHQMTQQRASNCTRHSVANFISRSTSSSTANSSAADNQSLRRRRRRRGKTLAEDEQTSSSSSSSSRRYLPDSANISASHQTSNEILAFAPQDTDGNLLTSDEYLKMASMSPWVPCPDMVIKRVFEIAEAGGVS
jgi:hypothetical protein